MHIRRLKTSQISARSKLFHPEQTDTLRLQKLLCKRIKEKRGWREEGGSDRRSHIRSPLEVTPLT
jgi:hypothetical protein